MFPVFDAFKIIINKINIISYHFSRKVASKVERLLLVCDIICRRRKGGHRVSIDDYLKLCKLNEFGW